MPQFSISASFLEGNLILLVLWGVKYKKISSSFLKFQEKQTKGYGKNKIFNKIDVIFWGATLKK